MTDPNSTRCLVALKARLLQVLEGSLPVAGHQELRVTQWGAEDEEADSVLTGAASKDNYLRAQWHHGASSICPATSNLPPQVIHGDLEN